MIRSSLAYLECSHVLDNHMLIGVENHLLMVFAKDKYFHKKQRAEAPGALYNRSLGARHAVLFYSALSVPSLVQMEMTEDWCMPRRSFLACALWTTCADKLGAVKYRAATASASLRPCG